MAGFDTQDVPEASDSSRLERLGYKPQFPRLLGLFADFSLGYSYMSPMGGAFALFAISITAAGPAFFWSLPIVLVGQALVCLVFAEAASAYPIAGGVYQWARQLAGQRWGFLTAWIYVLALAATVAGVATGNASFLAGLIGIEATPAFNVAAAFGLALLAILSNLAGTRVLARATEIGVWAGLLGLAFCGVYMLLFARVQPFSVLTDMAGHGEGGLLAPMLAASLMGIWIFFGFEACGDLAEEVEGASKIVPRAMLLTIGCGGVSALLITLGLILAVPDLAGAASGAVADPVSTALQQSGGAFGSKLALVCLNIINVSAACSLLASASRLLFSLGRDGLVFGHRALSRLDRRGAPSGAILAASVLVLLILCIGLVSSDALTLIISFATTGIYTAFQMVVVACLLAGLKAWKPDGAFRLGGFALPVRVLALVFGIGAILNLAWPRAPESGWFVNWFVVIAMGVIVLLGIAQAVLFVPGGTGAAAQVPAE